MLLSLSIRDFVLVDRLDIEFAAGFSVLTGETGAGKSILLDALGLTLGERAEAGVIREGAERAEVAASFAIAGQPGLAAWLDDSGLDGDAGECILRRSVDRGGRSRAFVNGHPATLGQLRTVGEYLVDIHGQHAHYSLLRPGAQRAMLDAFAGVEALAAQVADAYHAWQSAERQCREAEANAAEAAAERERLQWRLDELDALDFRAGEWQELQERQRRLAHAVELIQGAQEVVAALDDEARGAGVAVHAARARLNDLAGLDPDLRGPAEILDACLIEIQEATRELSRYADRLETDPDALAQADARIAQINDAARKFRVRAEELPDLREASRVRLAEMARLADIDGLRRIAAAAEAGYQAVAARLTAERTRAAGRLADAVTESMQRLAMPGGVFAVSIVACAAEAGGLERVEFMVAPHAGQGLKALARTASGGELSRLGLALQTVLSGVSGAPTLIFDEVDAGIGGGVAESVGHLLAALGRSRQVLCVTHLPQVAAAGDEHWRVTKDTVAGRALSRVERLSPVARVEEVARMLGGVRITETTRRHAAEMLGTG